MAAATIGLGAATLAVGLTVWWWRTSSRTRASRRLGPSSTSTPSSALTTPQVEPDGRHQLRVGRALSAPSRSAAQDLIYAIHDRDIKEAKGRRASVRLFYRQSNQEELCFTRSITGGGGGSEYRINGSPVTWDQYNAKLRSLGILVMAACLNFAGPHRRNITLLLLLP